MDALSCYRETFSSPLLFNYFSYNFSLSKNLLDALYSRALLISWNHEIVPWRSKASLEFESFESNYGNISKVPYISAGYFLSSQTSSSEDFPRRSILNNVIRKWSMKITRSIAWNKIQLQRDWTETWINEIKN